MLIQELLSNPILKLHGNHIHLNSEYQVCQLKVYLKLSRLLFDPLIFSFRFSFVVVSRDYTEVRRPWLYLFVGSCQLTPAAGLQFGGGGFMR